MLLNSLPWKVSEKQKQYLPDTVCLERLVRWLIDSLRPVHKLEKLIIYSVYMI